MVEQTETPERPVALVSYAHADGHVSVNILCEELRLRGITVLRDVENFEAGKALSSEMGRAVDVDLVVCHLGPEALESTAVKKKEVGPSLDSARQTGRPVVLIVPHGIGASRDEIDATIAGRLLYSSEATWAPSAESSTGDLSIGLCQGVAKQGISSLFGKGRGPDDGHWSLKLVTRGTTQHGEGLVIDATALIGGTTRHVGSPDEWRRLRQGIDDLAEVLRASGARRQIEIESSAHGSASILLGSAFSVASGWQISVKGRDGVVQSSGTRNSDQVGISSSDGKSGDGRLFVGIDLANRGVAQGIANLCSSLGALPERQLFVERVNTDRDLSPEEIADAAATAASAIRSCINDFPVSRIELFIAAPAPFSVLLGAELDTLDPPIGLWEYDGSQYVHTTDLTAIE